MHVVIISQKVKNVIQHDEIVTGGNFSKTLTKVSEHSHRDHAVDDIHMPGFEQEVHELIQFLVE
jgi:hypothetical protein